MTDIKEIHPSKGGFLEANEQVKKLLGCLPRGDGGCFYQMRLQPKKGRTFYFSIQASRKHYCHPTKDLPKLTDYEEVEVGIFYELGDYPLQFLQPSEVGLHVLHDNSLDVVLPGVLVEDIIRELVIFFLGGGSIFIEPPEHQEPQENLLVLDAAATLPQKDYKELPDLED